MISVIGGKLTTAGSLARECVAKIGVQAHPPELVIVSENRVDQTLERWVEVVANAGGIGVDKARGIAEWYGRRAVAVAGEARGRPELRAPLCPHTGHIVAEAVDAFNNECACTLADVLLRRVPVALGACWSSSCSRDAATRVAAALAWSEKRAAVELEGFEQERSEFLPKASATGAH